MTRRQEIHEQMQRERAKQQDADLVALLSTASGRRFVMGMLARGGVWARTGVESDPARMAYMMGRRDVCCDLLGHCNRVAADMMQLAMHENNERIKRYRETLQECKEEDGDEWQYQSE